MDAQNTDTLDPPKCGFLPSAFQINWEWTIKVVDTNTGGNTVYGPVSTWVAGNGWCSGTYDVCYNPSNYEDLPYMFGVMTLNSQTWTWTFQGQVYNELPNGTPGGEGFGCAGMSVTFSPPIQMPAVTCSESPILIDVNGEGFHLTDAAHGVLFRERVDSPQMRLSWTDPAYHNGWLALPRDGKVQALSELFGNFTPQPPSDGPNGFRALAVYDLNHDGVIDSQDAIYSQLRVWIDQNHDGIAQPEELHTLSELGIERISLDYHESRWVDRWGNQFRYESSIDDRDAPRDHRTYDVFLVTK